MTLPSEPKGNLEICSCHESIKPHVLLNIHLNEWGVSNIKSWQCFHFGYIIMLGFTRIGGLLNSAMINTKGKEIIGKTKSIVNE